MVGDLVLVADKKSSRGTWPVGRITKVMPGKDGIVRTAVVQTQYGEYVRPAIKLFVFQEVAGTPDVNTEENGPAMLRPFSGRKDLLEK